MTMIDPRKRAAAREAEGKSATPELGEGTPRIECECRVPGAVVGWEHYKSSRKGTPGMLTRFVCLDGPDAGKITETTFWLTDAALDQFADFLLCLGHNEPVDPYNDDHLADAFGKGAVMMDVKGENYTDRDGNPRTSYRPAWFGKYNGKGNEKWNAIMEASEAGWSRYVEWRRNNPRPEPGSQPVPRQAQGGSGGNVGDDDEIPF